MSAENISSTFSLSTTINQNEKEDGEIIEDDELLFREKYLYQFDYPYLLESGFVKTSKNKIIASFPEKNVQSSSETFQSNQNVQLYINNQLKFSYQWLPIYSAQDLLKVKDILTKCYYDYKKFTNSQKDIMSETLIYYPIFHQETLTKGTSSSVSVRCFENPFNSTIEVNTVKSTGNYTYNHDWPIVEIWIGKYNVFCSSTDLNMSPQENKFVTEFILNKLVKF